MTVYELIQQLAEFPADKPVWVQISATDRQLNDYMEECVNESRTRIDGDIEDVDWKYYGDVVQIEVEVSDL